MTQESLPEEIKPKSSTSVETGVESTVRADASPNDSPTTESDADALFAFADLNGRMIGHYRVEERLGGGAMASVYRATDEILERTVALKVLLPGADDLTRERFRQEARTVSVLEHPNIVPTYQVGQTSANGTIYIAMEMILGENLSGVLSRVGKMNVEDTCRLLEPVARALAYAHTNGVVHRDVKPGNILLRSAEAETDNSVAIAALPQPITPLLSDFGIARALDSPELTSAGRTIGTPAFMSPEQCAGNSEIDGRADIYSLGAVLYRCLVGRAPYTGTTTKILYAHVYEPLTIPEDVLVHLPPVVVEILTRAMMKEPEQRYQSADQLADDLDVACGGAVAAGPSAADIGSTMTMPSLPAARPPTTTASQVLVPAPNVQQRSQAQPLTPTTSDAGVKQTRATAPSAPAAKPRRRNRLGLATLSVALFLLVAVLTVSLITNVLPATSPTPQPGATVDLSQSSNTEPKPDNEVNPTPGGDTDSGNVGITIPTPTRALSANQPTAQADDSRATPASDTTPESPVSSVQPTPAVSISSAWDDAQAFYDEQDWEQAYTWLTLVRRIDEGFEKARVDGMLYDSFVGLAHEANAADRPEDAVVYLKNALELRPDEAFLSVLYDAAVTYAGSGGAARTRALRALQGVYVAEAANLAEEEDFCQAARLVSSAVGLQPEGQIVDVLNEYRELCTGGVAEEAESDPYAEFDGRILYSAEQGDRDRIMMIPVVKDAVSTTIIDDGSQPSLRPDGVRVAFYSSRSDMQGLAGFDLNTNLDMSDRSIRYTEFVEDGRDSPAGWNPQNDRLVYASTNYGDGRSRIYLTWADGGRDTTTLGYGKDPAWHPTQNQIVYNGIDETGNRPGLWLINADGSNPTRLTEDGNDIRPTWTPDGNSVVFMSSGRSGNWDIYRIDLASRQVTQLTDHAAQDGLPAVSPDGKYVSFMSDRDGVWRIWVVPTEGGEALPLAYIAGELPRWLEHSQQWVE